MYSRNVKVYVHNYFDMFTIAIANSEHITYVHYYYYYHYCIDYY